MPVSFSPGVRDENEESSISAKVSASTLPMSCDMWQVYYGIDLICLFLLFRENRYTRVVQVTHDCDCYDCYYHVYLQQSIVIFMS